MDNLYPNTVSGGSYTELFLYTSSYIYSPSSLVASVRFQFLNTEFVTSTEHIAHFTSASCQNMPNVELKDLILFFVIFVAFVANCIFVCAFIYFKRIMSPPPMDQSEMWAEFLIIICWLWQEMYADDDALHIYIQRPLFEIFIGPRTGKPGVRSLGPSVRLSVRLSKTFVKLNWCDSGWWRYQLNTNW